MSTRSPDRTTRLPADLPMRPGVRRATDAEPTGAFVVVEMAILVLVTALAMVAIIVATGEDAGPSADATSRSPRTQPARDRALVDDLLRTRSTEPDRRTIDVASR